ncbi:archaellin/type IV pilin N-terminal domain-containing protein [Natranaeroarchaeum aerophilus]|nr:archaellin/type IV pilin N-terminal domain-containing protein [Natranaeroarchaeum aerophilus]
MEISIPEFTRDNDRGQVGIETLIVFIAMILVAAIAASVLINTAGFLQNQASETSQDSEDQVSNQVLIISSIGEIEAEGEAVFELDLDNDEFTLTELNADESEIDFVVDQQDNEDPVNSVSENEDFSGQLTDFSALDGDDVVITFTDENDGETTLTLNAEDGETDTGSVALDVRGNTVNEVSMTVMQSPGANEIDLAGASIEYIGPDGQRLLSYSDDPEVGEFGVEGTQDPENTVPVLTEREDRYTVTIELETDDTSDLRYLEEGEDATVRINTQAGSEAVTILNVPQSISSYDQGDAVEL